MVIRSGAKYTVPKSSSLQPELEFRYVRNVSKFVILKLGVLTRSYNPSRFTTGVGTPLSMRL